MNVGTINGRRPRSRATVSKGRDEAIEFHQVLSNSAPRSASERSLSCRANDKGSKGEGGKRGGEVKSS